MNDMTSLRTAELAVRHLGETARRIWKILRVLFHEVMGLLFLVIAAWGLLWMVRTYREFHGEGETVFKLAVVGIFVLMMGGFGLSSFWRARRLSRSK
jgi:hypothetical protein